MSKTSVKNKSIQHTIGKHLGYPSCCIDYFILTNGSVGNHLGRLASRGTGFIPCRTHALRILKQEIKLRDLIVERKHSLPFPEVDEDKMYKELYGNTNSK